MPSRLRKESVRGLWLSRDQFARFLHDGPAQSIAAIAMRINIARQLMDKDASKAFDELDQAEEQTRRASKEMRYLLFVTQAKSLRNYGLGVALQDLAEQSEETFEQQVHLEVDKKSIEGIDSDFQSLLFFMALEAMTMARKQKGVENIWLRLQLAEKDLLLLEVQYDGQGFDIPDSAKGNHPSDENDSDSLPQLVKLANGKLRFTKGDDNINRMQIWTPLNEKAAGRLRNGA